MCLNNILENIKLDVAANQALGMYLFVLFNLEFRQINGYLSPSSLHTETDVLGSKITLQFDFSRTELASEGPLTARRGRQRITDECPKGCDQASWSKSHQFFFKKEDLS